MTTLKESGFKLNYCIKLCRDQAERILGSVPKTDRVNARRVIYALKKQVPWYDEMPKKILCND